jgi:Rrf2 family transcriptional regulator, iron-sulfur cluster assembly transcription factor
LGVTVELTTKGRYAVMAMVDIAHRAHWDGVETVPLSHIAERQNISLAYLEQLFLKLRRADLVDSARGRTGGYRLSRAPEAITVREIMSAVEEETAMTRCGHKAETPCLAGQRCSTHDLWSALGNHIDQFLSRVTLADIVEGRLEVAPSKAAQAASVLRATGLVGGGKR